MSAWVVVVLTLAGVWLVGAVFAAGLLWEREHLQDNADTRAPGWWFAYLVSALAWPVILPLWGSSRPAPSPAAHVQAAADAGVHEGLKLARLERRGLPEGLSTVDRPATLALCGRAQVGERVWVKSLGLVLTRGQMFWFGDCGCRYNFAGFPVVLCRQHRSDTDPQGEPDESEGEVGR